jgi:tRNA(Ile)-lysidine synthase
MHGILPKNDNLVRPLLFLTKDEIADIIQTEHFRYVEDSSNSSAKYARNKLRLEVIPKLKELNPKLEDTFERNLEHFRSLELLLDQKLAGLRKYLFVSHDEAIHIPIQAVKKLNPQQLLLFGLLQEYGFNETAVDDIISSLDKHSGRVFDATNYTLVVDRQDLILSKKQNEPAAIKINAGDHEAHYGQYKLNILHDDSALIIKDNPLATSIDTELLIYPLTVRSWQQSDYFYPLGMKLKKKLSDFFIGQKIPLHDKKQVPLLINGNGDIIWVGGYRPDNRYKVSTKTKKVTIFELYKL